MHLVQLSFKLHWSHVVHFTLVVFVCALLIGVELSIKLEVATEDACIIRIDVVERSGLDGRAPLPDSWSVRLTHRYLDCCSPPGPGWQPEPATHFPRHLLCWSWVARRRSNQRIEGLGLTEAAGSAWGRVGTKCLLVAHACNDTILIGCFLIPLLTIHSHHSTPLKASSLSPLPFHLLSVTALIIWHLYPQLHTLRTISLLQLRIDAAPDFFIREVGELARFFCVVVLVVVEDYRRSRWG